MNYKDYIKNHEQEMHERVLVAKQRDKAEKALKEKIENCHNCKMCYYPNNVNCIQK